MDHTANNPLPKVSILIPVYRVEGYIEGFAHSVFGQTYANIEYVIVDDASPDRSMTILTQVLASYPQRKNSVRIIRHHKNRGLAGARNTALDHYSGDYILFADSDDKLDRTAVAKLVDAATSQNADVVIFDMNIDDGKKIRSSRDKIGATKEDYIKRLLLRKSTVSLCLKFFDAAVIRTSGIRFREGLDYGEDFLMSPQFVYYADRIIKLDDPLYTYMDANAGAYTNNISVRSLDSITAAVDILEGFFSQVPDHENYEEVLPLMKLRTKVDLIKVSPRQLRTMEIRMYNDTRHLERTLPLVDRIVLYLARKNKWGMLDWFITRGLRIKRILGLK